MDMYPRRRNVATSMVELEKKKRSHAYAKICPEMVNLRCVAWNAEEEHQYVSLQSLVAAAG